MNWGKFLLFIVIGFAAQIIDGTLGMAYGVSCRTFLKTVAGLPSALASAVVHVAEVPTTLASVSPISSSRTWISRSFSIWPSPV